MCAQDDKLHCTFDEETGLLTAACYIIMQRVFPHTEAGEATLRFHGFGGEGTVTLYANKERLEEVLSTLNPEQGWMAARAVLATRVKVEAKSETEKE